MSSSALQLREFYVVPERPDRSDIWLVCTDSLTRCIGIYATQDDALADAIIKARYETARGRPTIVKSWSFDAGSWRTSWPGNA